MKALFKVLGEGIRVVLLNACYSHDQALAISETVDFVIGMKGTISNEGAVIFASSFYRAIGFGCTVKDAFEQGKVALLLEGIPESEIPVLVTKAGRDPALTPLVSTEDSVQRSMFGFLRLMGKGSRGETLFFEFSSPIVRIGRALDNDVVLQDKKVSWYHGFITRNSQECCYYHTSETNATIIRRSHKRFVLKPGRQGKFVLRSGDRIMIDDNVLAVEFSLVPSEEMYTTTEEDGE